MKVDTHTKVDFENGNPAFAKPMLGEVRDHSAPNRITAAWKRKMQGRLKLQTLLNL